MAGWGDKSVSQLLIQPFVNYNLADGWYLTSAPIMTADWENDSGDQWTVPVGGGFGKLLRVGSCRSTPSCRRSTTPRRRKFGPDWQLRFQVQFLLPKF